MINASSTFFLEKKGGPPCASLRGQAKIQAQSMRNSLFLPDTFG
jgi:hypothetical protein